MGMSSLLYAALRSDVRRAKSAADRAELIRDLCSGLLSMACSTPKWENLEEGEERLLEQMTVLAATCHARTVEAGRRELWERRSRP